MSNERYDTIPVSWYRVASSSSLHPIGYERHIVYRLGTLLAIRRQADGQVVVTSDRGARAWPVREHGGEIFVWYGPEDAAVGPFPEWPGADSYPVRSSWAQHVAANLSIIDENSCDTAHLTVVHGKTLNSGTMKAHVDDGGRLVVVSQMNAYALRIEHSIVSVLHSPSMVLSKMRFMGFEMSLYGMFTPIDEGHTENHFTVASPRWAGVAHLVNKIFFRRLAEELGRDIPIWEHVRYRERPLLAEGDGAIPLFRKWYRGFFPRAWAEHHPRAVSPPRGLVELAAR